MCEDNYENMLNKKALLLLRIICIILWTFLPYASFTLAKAPVHSFYQDLLISCEVDLLNSYFSAAAEEG